LKAGAKSFHDIFLFLKENNINLIKPLEDSIKGNTWFNSEDETKNYFNTLKQCGIKFSDNDSYSVFYGLSNRGYIDLVKELVSMGMNVNSNTTFGGRTPLMGAASWHLVAQECNSSLRRISHREVCEFLLDNGANVDDVCNKRKTALMYACERGHASLIDTLLKRGANVELKCKSGLTPLHHQCKGPNINLECIKLLVDAGANVERRTHDGMTPLSFAVFGGNAEVLRYFVNTCKVNLDDSKISYCDGNLLLSSSEHSLDFVKYLCEEGQSLKLSIDKKAKGEALIQYLHRMKYETPGSAEIVSYLIDADADFESNLDGETPLMIAVQIGDINIISKITEKCENIDTSNRRGQTSLFYACKFAMHPVEDPLNTEVCKILLDKGASVNVQDMSGKTPLNVLLSLFPATLSERRDLCYSVAKALLEAGADPCIADERGAHPLLLAIMARDEQTALILLDHGAKPTTSEEFPRAMQAGMQSVIVKMVENGMMPRFDNLKPLNIHFNSALVYRLPPLVCAFVKRNLFLVEFFLSRNFFSEDIFRHSSSEVLKMVLDDKEKNGEKEDDDKILELLDIFFQNSLHLQTLALIKVSETIGYRKDREHRLSLLGLPSSMKKQLMFKSKK